MHTYTTIQSKVNVGKCRYEFDKKLNVHFCLYLILSDVFVFGMQTMKQYQYQSSRFVIDNNLFEKNLVTNIFFCSLKLPKLIVSLFDGQSSVKADDINE